MADTYTSNLRLRKPEVGQHEDTWAELLNDDFIQLAEDAIAGRSDINVAAGNVTLTTQNGGTDQARSMFLRATGAPGTTRNIVVPDLEKLYVVQNDADADVLITVTSPAGVTVAPGAVTFVHVYDGVVNEITIEPPTAVIDEPAALSDLTLDIEGVGVGGDTQVAAHYTIQGSVGYINIEGFDAEDFDAGEMGLLPTGGSWPAALLPVAEKSFPVLLYEDTGGGFELAPAELIVGTGTTDAWVIRPLDAEFFTTASDRQVPHSMTLVFALQGPAGTAQPWSEFEAQLSIDVNLTEEFNVEDELVAAYGFSSAAWNTVRVTIAEGVEVYPQSTAHYAINGSDMHADSHLTIVGADSVMLHGRGGDGGRGADDDSGTGELGEDGHDGGDAIILGCDTVLTGSGAVRNGYGGGGGGGASSAPPVALGGGGGGGGAAFGTGGDPGATNLSLPEFTPDPGEDGTLTTGGEGGLGEGVDEEREEQQGGDGGGDNGAATAGSGTTGTGSAGNPGKAVELNGFTLDQSAFTGTITGTVS